MGRITYVVVLATALIGLSFVSTGHARVYRNQVQNAAKCHQMIDPKGLKGDAFKGEMSKCKENPDNYK